MSWWIQRLSTGRILLASYIKRALVIKACGIYGIAALMEGATEGSGPGPDHNPSEWKHSKV